jgi:hypothetical protein
VLETLLVVGLGIRVVVLIVAKAHLIGKSADRRRRR